MNDKLKLLLLGSGILISTSSARAENSYEDRKGRESREEDRKQRDFFRGLREFFRGNSREHSHVSNCNSSCTVESEESEDGSFDVNDMSNYSCRTDSSSQAHNSSCSVK